jgi:hypothetical protein
VIVKPEGSMHLRELGSEDISTRTENFVAVAAIFFYTNYDEVLMNKHNFFSLAAIAVTLVALAPISKANLILNGGFNLSSSETATPTDWTNIGPSDGVIADSVFGTPSYLGFTNYFDTGGYGDSLPATGDGIEQTVATVIGTNYTLSLGVSNENYTGYGPEFLDILVNGTTIQTYPVAYNSSYGGFQLPWATDVVNFTAASTSSTIAFTVTGSNLGGQDPLIAGVDLEAASSTVPEPSTCFTVLTALGLLAFGYRKSSNLRGDS